MRVIIAPDKFKGSLPADAVAEALAAGIRQVTAADVDLVPMADGGDGTVEAALRAGYTASRHTVTGPVGEPVEAIIAVRGDTAVVELAAASGLALLPTDSLAPLTATSRGTGELLTAALDAGCSRIVLGLGGSACTDGGAGLLAALGVRFLDVRDGQLPDGGAALVDLARVDVSGLDARLAGTDVVVALDVDNPLLGARGAAETFGPQKGASPDQVRQLDDALAHYAGMLAAALGPDIDRAAVSQGAGAAGGVGFAAIAVLGATPQTGLELVADLVGLAERVHGADLVITGEGSLDEQSLSGKTPVGVARIARAAGVAHVVAVCGVSTLDENQVVAGGFDAIWTLADLESDTARSIANAAALLTTTGERIGHWIATKEKSMTESPALAHVNQPDVVRQQIADFVAAHGDPRSTPSESGSTAGPIDLVIRGPRVLVDGEESPREVAVAGGQIAAIKPLGSGLQAPTIVDLGVDEVLIPGVVDAHVHVNEPGRTEWEGFATATRAAAAGGVTTIIDMPLNSIPSTVTVPALDYKRMVASGQLSVDVGFWGGAVPGNREELRGLQDAGVFGFKCFLLDSGVEEFPPLTPDALRDYLTEIAEFDGLMIVHAEDAATIDGATPAHGTRYADFLKSRPRDAENLAIALVIERARETGARVHILHLSSSDALPLLRAAKLDGIDVTAETCPHYLTLSSEDVPGGGTAYKCCPPIREGANRELLWNALADGTIDYIASDHSPSTVELKDLEHGDFGTAWGGIASVQLALPVVWTEARRRGIDLASVSEWMSARPAERIGLRRKGKLAVGYDADLAVFAPDEEFVVDAGRLQHKNPVSAYDGKELTGVVRRTFVRGQEATGADPAGRLLERGRD